MCERERRKKCGMTVRNMQSPSSQCTHSNMVARWNAETSHV